MTGRVGLSALAVALAACSAPPTLPSAPVAPAAAPSPEPSAEPAPSAEELPAPVPEVRTVAAEERYDGERAMRVARLAAAGRALFDAFSDVSPQPVTRGYTQQTWVQYRTDRRTPGTFAWVEAPTMALHHPPVVAAQVEPCKTPLAVGATVRGARGEAELVRTPDHDELRVGTAPPLALVRLPRGASHGACLGPDGTRVWVAWSTPEHPAELFSIGLKDGAIRALRNEAHPVLGTLGDARAESIALGGGPAALLAPAKQPARATVVVPADEPLASWSALARLGPEAGVRVVRVPRAAAGRALAEARTTWLGPSMVVSDDEPPAASPAAWIVREKVAVAPSPPGSLLIGVGSGAEEAVRASLIAGDPTARWTIARGDGERAATGLAWARALDAALVARLLAGALRDAPPPAEPARERADARRERPHDPRAREAELDGSERPRCAGRHQPADGCLLRAGALSEAPDHRAAGERAEDERDHDVRRDPRDDDERARAAGRGREKLRDVGGRAPGHERRHGARSDELGQHRERKPQRERQHGPDARPVPRRPLVLRRRNRARRRCGFLAEDGELPRHVTAT